MVFEKLSTVHFLTTPGRERESFPLGLVVDSNSSSERTRGPVHFVFVNHAHELSFAEQSVGGRMVGVP